MVRDSVIVRATCCGCPSHWYVVVGYVVAMFFLALHLYHGAWSSMRTLGLSRPSPRPTHRSVATVVAAIVTLGFVAVPLAVLFRVVKPNPNSERLGTPRADSTAAAAATALGARR